MSSWCRWTCLCGCSAVCWVLCSVQCWRCWNTLWICSCRSFLVLYLIFFFLRISINSFSIHLCLTFSSSFLYLTTTFSYPFIEFWCLHCLSFLHPSFLSSSSSHFLCHSLVLYVFLSIFYPFSVCLRLSARSTLISVSLSSFFFTSSSHFILSVCPSSLVPHLSC